MAFFAGSKIIQPTNQNVMETIPTSDVVIVHGNSHPELANLIAG